MALLLSFRVAVQLGVVVFLCGLIYFGIIALLYVAQPLYAAQYDYTSKHVVITGGSSGIGLETAKIYIRLGANVTIVGRNQSRLDEALMVLRTLCGPNQSVITVSVDCGSSLEEVSDALAPALSNLGFADVIVNCAGTSVAGEFDALNPEEFERMLRTNVLGSIYPTRAVLAGMKSRKRGRIVFVSSQVAHVAIYGYSAYAASKWALRGLAEALQMEVKPYNIYVSVVYPPDTATPGYELEMQSKPDITKKLSDSGTLFQPERVAADLEKYSTRGYFGISTGLDGWLLKQLHPGMSPLNNVWEVTEGILFASWARLISIFYLVDWDRTCYDYVWSGNKETLQISPNINETMLNKPLNAPVDIRYSESSHA